MSAKTTQFYFKVQQDAGCLVFAEKELWDSKNHLDDTIDDRLVTVLEEISPGMFNNIEGCFWEFDGDLSDVSEILINYGFIYNEDLA